MDWEAKATSLVKEAAHHFHSQGKALGLLYERHPSISDRQVSLLADKRQAHAYLVVRAEGVVLVIWESPETIVCQLDPDFYYAQTEDGE
jgi:hypothetical protein